MFRMPSLYCPMKQVLLLVFFTSLAMAAPLVYEGSEGPGKGRHIVFIASDHEYKSEETLPMLARILAKHQGFKCTVLFGMDEKTGELKPGNSFIPGTEALKTAELMVIFTRFQNLPADQMQPIVDYLQRGGPVVGLRTATHGFKIPKDSPFAKYDYQYKGDDFKNGFGRQILGETWVGHYGPNHKSSTRLDVVPDKAGHPVLTGVTSMWAEIGAYNAYPIEGSEVLAMAQPLNGMTPDSPVDDTKKPMPGAWVRTYKSASGKEGRVFATTYGGSGDLVNDGFRRLLVNACFWTLGLESSIKPDLNISLVGPYRPTWMNVNKRSPHVKPEDLAGWDTPILPEK
ncbi:MAG: signal peptide-domain containing protein [Verrucomicrobiaceae bacterium]|nr:signal peptide-domain containing protein [Verrucomicrobiaceae bacterium]